MMNDEKWEWLYDTKIHRTYTVRSILESIPLPLNLFDRIQPCLDLC